MKKIWNDKKPLIGVVAALAVLVAASALLANQKSQLDPGLIKYTDPKYGFSFWYPKRAELITNLEAPKLARIVFAEGYLDAEGKPANYMIEITFGQVEEELLYSREVRKGEDVFTISLRGSPSQEIPKRVDSGLEAVTDSFRL